MKKEQPIYDDLKRICGDLEKLIERETGEKPELFTICLPSTFFDKVRMETVGRPVRYDVTGRSINMVICGGASICGLGSDHGIPF